MNTTKRINGFALPERLKTARGNRTLADVASASGLTVQALSRYEKGGNCPSAEMLAKLCVSLNASADYLLGLVDDPHGTSSGSVISAPNNRGSIAQNSPGATVTSGTDCANCARVLKLQAQLEVLKDLLRKG